MTGLPEVVLGGRHTDSFQRLVAATASIQHRLRGRRSALVGGLAVAARLSVPERATADVDHVVDRPRRGPDAVKILVAHGDVVHESGIRVVLDGVAVDVVDAPPADEVDPVFLSWDEGLYHAGNRFALETAWPVRLVAGGASADVRVATPAALVVTKLHAALHRSEEAKKATDVFDLHRLLQDHDRGGALAAVVAKTPPPLPALVASAAERVFVEEVSEFARHLRRSGDATVRAVTVDDLAAVGETFLAVLEAEAHL